MKHTYPYIYTSYSEIFAVIITTVRKEKKVSQKQVADYLGLTVAAVSKLETGGTQVTLDHIYALSIALDMDISVLLRTIDLGVSYFKREGGYIDNSFYRNENSWDHHILPKKNNKASDTSQPRMGYVSLKISWMELKGTFLIAALGTDFTDQLRALIESKNNHNF